MNIIRCDKCGKEVENYYEVSVPGRRPVSSPGAIGYYGERKEWQLCDECFYDVIELVTKKRPNNN